MTPQPTRLRELAEAAGMERYDVAALLRRTEAMVRRYENGDTPIPMPAARILATKFGCTIDYLMGDEEMVA